jgi:hypothetical protein
MPESLVDIREPYAMETAKTFLQNEIFDNFIVG